MTAAGWLPPGPSDAPAVATSSSRSLITGEIALAAALRRYRAANDLSVRAAGELVGGSHWVWAQWEAGVVPGPAYLRRIAELLGITEPDARLLAGPDRVRRPQSVGEEYSNALARARFAAGLSAADLARRLHVSAALVSRWENGSRTPAAIYRPRLAEVLGVTVEDVAGWHADDPARSDCLLLVGLRAARTAACLTQRDLAGKLRVDVSTVQRWERVGRVPVHQARELAGVLGVDLATLSRPVLAPAARRAPASPLRGLRLRRKLSVHTVAAQVGVSRSALLAWERGAARPSWAHARELARILDAPVERVFAAAKLDPPAHLDPRRWCADDLPAIIRELRTWQGLSQQRFAEIVGVSAATVAGWEGGTQRPRTRALRKIDSGLGMRYKLGDIIGLV